MIIRIITTLMLVLVVAACEKKAESPYNMEQRYWAVADYEEPLRHLRYLATMEKALPRLSDPETAAVFRKLVDKENVSIVLEDPQLGVTHKSTQAKGFFDVGKELMNVYQSLDAQDKYIYPSELVNSIEFFLHTQILYFKAGNEAITKDAIDPEESSVKRLINSNEQIIVDNFNQYIDFLTREDSFDDEAKKKYAEAINTYYPKLLETFPKADYSRMKEYALKLGPKMKSPAIKSALDNVIDKINLLPSAVD
jgi:hypothetical protein